MQFSEFPSSKPVVQIPNWALILLFLAYALPGNIGHVPWRGDDVLHISVAYAMLQEGHWLSPTLAGAAYTDWGPLTYWLGAASGKLLGGLLTVHDAIRLSMALAVGVVAVSLRSAARVFYGREVASAVVLLSLGSLGLLVHAHEMQPQIVLLACMSLNFLGIARLGERPALGAMISGAAAGAGFLTAGLIGLMLTLPLLLLAPWLHAEPRRPASARPLLPGLAPLALLVCGWLGALYFVAPDYLSAWLNHQLARALPHAGHFQQFKSLGNLIGWFTWPLWPVALWSLWHRRSRYVSFGHAIPIASLVLALWFVTTTGPLRPANALPLLPPLILIAAAELCRLRRGASNAFDWFGVLTFSLLGIFLWLAWTGLNLGWPSGLARNVLRVMPGFSPSWLWLELAVAIALSVAWLVAIIKVPFFQLRGAVHWALGVILMWGLATTLWLSWFDYDKNYQRVSAQIVQAIRAENLPPEACIAGKETGDAQRAGLYYFGGLKLQMTASAEATCPLLLAYASGRRELPPVSATRELVWQTERGRGRLRELFALYRKADAAAP